MQKVYFFLHHSITGDADILAGRLETISENTGCTDMYVDGGFNSDEVREAAKENGIEIHQTNMSGTEPRKKLPTTDFDIDRTTYAINGCPGGHIPSRSWVSGIYTSAHFSHEACAGCELREKCYSKPQVKGCAVYIPIKTIEVGWEREKMKAEQIENTGKRAGIEGTNSALKRTGQKKLDVRGIEKCTLVSGLKVTVQNIKRFIKFMQGGYKPKNVNIPVTG